jgi:hypothetical protein
MDASPFYYAVWASAGGALILGAVLNLLLLMMIRRHSPPELHAFSSLLAQTVVIDLHVVVFTFLVMPVSHFYILKKQPDKIGGNLEFYTIFVEALVSSVHMQILYSICFHFI